MTPSSFTVSVCGAPPHVVSIVLVEGWGNTSDGQMHHSASSPETKIFPILPGPWEGSNVQWVEVELEG